MSLALGLALMAAAPFADLDAVDREVARFTGAQIGEPGGATLPVDRRLRLRPCATGLSLNWRTQRRDTVQVQCGDAGGWRLFVPVSAGRGSGEAEAIAVNRGDAVSIMVSGGGFSVSRPGEAMESGAVGSWIRVRPQTVERIAKEPLRARIVGPGMVELPLP